MAMIGLNLSKESLLLSLAGPVFIFVLILESSIFSLESKYKWYNYHTAENLAAMEKAF